jgi:hypothetical protein
MLRRLLALVLALTLSWTLVACNDSTPPQAQQSFKANLALAPNQVSSGKYPVQQASYDDIDGTYSLMLLNTPAGKAPIFRTANLQMARLSDEALTKGEKTYVDINGNQAVMYLTEDFKIEYVHNVAETQTNPQTGQPETVIVRQQSSFWTPFAGALAGQALGSLLFTPQYYVPPVYRPGTVMQGYGGYGNTYDRAVQSYQSTHNAPPPAVKNRQTLRTTGNLKKTSSSSTTTSRKPSSSATKGSGSGYGSSKLRSSGQTSPNRVKSRSSFGSSSGMRTRSFSRGGGRRR